MRRKGLIPLICMAIVGMLYTACSQKADSIVRFKLYGTDFQVRFDASNRVAVNDGSGEEFGKCLKWIESSTQETLADCQHLKKEYNLSDWAYLQMLNRFAVASLDSTNEAVLLMYSLLTRSGYGAFVNVYTDGQLRLWYHSDAFVYNKPYFYRNEKWYYLFGDSIPNDDDDIRIAKEGRPIDFRYQGEMRLSYAPTQPRTIISVRNPDFSFTVQMNKNLIDYYGDLPSVYYNENFMTRWAVMAEYPFEQQVKDSLITPMKVKLAGKSQQEQVQQLLSWIHGRVDIKRENPNQNCFLFAFDEAVWGYDRNFFPEETLFYPYCDSEDRSILLARLVRDVVGLDCVLVYYPGHLATAVRFTETPVKGDYVVWDNQQYIVCDPTYIGSDVGETMPNMRDKDTKVIQIKR